MDGAARARKPWDAHDYQRIVAAGYENGELVVRFGDGAEARVDVTRMPRVQERGPDWQALIFDEFEVVVPTREGPFEIPWLPIRSLTDPAFHAYLDAAAVESARQIGARIQELRQRQGLSLEDVSARSGITPETLERIERGEAGINLPIQETILTSIGHSFRDLVAEPSGRVAAAPTP